MPGKLKAKDLRREGRNTLYKTLETQRTELASLRVAAQTQGAAQRLANIKVARKAIARVLTVLSQKERAALRTDKYFKGDKFKPKALRPKYTHAIRTGLKSYEKAKQTAKQARLAAAYPRRNFAVKA